MSPELQDNHSMALILESRTAPILAPHSKRPKARLGSLIILSSVGSLTATKFPRKHSRTSGIRSLWKTQVPLYIARGRSHCDLSVSDKPTDNQACYTATRRC